MVLISYTSAKNSVKLSQLTLTKQDRYT